MFGVVLLVTAPAWIVLLLVVDLLLGRWRLPSLRLCAFGLVWAWLEVGGLVGAFATWVIGRARRASSQQRSFSITPHTRTSRPSRSARPWRC